MYDTTTGNEDKKHMSYFERDATNPKEAGKATAQADKLTTAEDKPAQADKLAQPNRDQPAQASTDIAERMTCERFIYDGDSSTLGSLAR